MRRSPTAVPEPLGPIRLLPRLASMGAPLAVVTVAARPARQVSRWLERLMELPSRRVGPGMFS
jgi:hypothetical protein